MGIILHQCLSLSLPHSPNAQDKAFSPMAGREAQLSLCFPQLCDLLRLSALYQTLPHHQLTPGMNLFSLDPSHGHIPAAHIFQCLFLTKPWTCGLPPHSDFPNTSTWHNRCQDICIGTPSIHKAVRFFHHLLLSCCFPCHFPVVLLRKQTEVKYLFHCSLWFELTKPCWFSSHSNHICLCHLFKAISWLGVFTIMLNWTRRAEFPQRGYT